MKIRESVASRGGVLFLLAVVGCSKNSEDAGDKNPGGDAGGTGGPAPLIQSFSSDVPLVFNGGKAMLSWDVMNIAPGEPEHRIVLRSSDGTLMEDVSATGQQEVDIAQTTEFVLTANNEQGSVSKTVQIFGGVFRVQPTHILVGQSARLSWSVPGAIAVDLSAATDAQPPEGELVVTPDAPIVYTLMVSELGRIGIDAKLEVEPAIALEIVAHPTSGVAPLSARFSPSVKNNNIVITSYEWDFDGDGKVDATDPFGAPRTYVYDGDPGQIFTAHLTAVTREGKRITATQDLVIENEPPEVHVVPSPLNGHVPLKVSFWVWVDGRSPGVDLIRIDFDGDGTFDDELPGEGQSFKAWTFPHTYDRPGFFPAVVEVSDRFGAVTVVRNNAVSVDAKDPKDPLVQLSSTVTNSGKAPLDVTLTAGSWFYDEDEIEHWSWDLDGDGTFETVGGAEAKDTESIHVSRVGIIYPAAKATSTKGRTSVAAVRVEASLPAVPSFSIPDENDSIHPYSGETAPFDVDLLFETDLELWIEDARRQRVRTLRTKQKTDPGTHSVSWDGRDDAGRVVSHGDYYVVVGYSAYGREHISDLRQTTGGVLSYYSRTKSNPRFFDRLEGPLAIEYAVDDPAEVTFFWQQSFSDRAMTLLEHERMGRGQYTLYWNGEHPSGKKADDSFKNLLPGILRYALPDNVIFVKEKPRIEDYALKSTIMSDPRREPIEFFVTLTKHSTVELIVADMEKGVDVASRVYADLSEGPQILRWDGKNDSNQYLAPGDYRMGVRSVDERGHRSLFWYRSQRIRY